MCMWSIAGAAIKRAHDAHPTTARQVPRVSCKHLQITFAWLTPLMQKGYSAPLEFRDIWALPPLDTVESVGSTFSEHWTEQMRSGAQTYMQVICACKRTG